MPRQTTLELVVPETAGPFVAFSALARMLELVATTASAEAGFPPQWYGAEGTIWVIRRSTIERLAPIAPGAALELRTWVADFRRVRSLREYEGRAAGGLVLRAHTDWVYVDRAAGKPRRIPQAMAVGFVPEGSVDTKPRAPLVVGDPPTGAKSVEWSVAADDLDALDHVNNAKYFDYVETVARDIVPAGMRPRSHDIEYLDEARAGERLRGVAWVSSSKKSAVVVATEIRRAAEGALLTRASSEWSS